MPFDQPDSAFQSFPDAYELECCAGYEDSIDLHRLHDHREISHRILWSLDRCHRGQLGQDSHAPVRYSGDRVCRCVQLE